jgi:low temperature requirement protein LtrA
VPGRPPLSHTTWEVETAHFAERFQLFMIIALGETIVITGATTAEGDIDTATVTAFGLAFLATAAMWWLYFNYVATIAQRRLELAPDRTRLARDGYTYLHVLMVAGIILAAVGDELMIAHPGERLSAEKTAAAVGGPALYLVAHALFRLRMAGSIAWKRLTAALACVVVGFLAGVVPALAVGALVVAVLVALIIAEHVAAHRRRLRGEPAPLERLETSAEVTRLGA